MGSTVDAVRRSTTPSGAILRDFTFYAERKTNLAMKYYEKI